jgi:hypothetical protein
VTTNQHMVRFSGRSQSCISHHRNHTTTPPTHLNPPFSRLSHDTPLRRPPPPSRIPCDSAPSPTLQSLQIVLQPPLGVCLHRRFSQPLRHLARGDSTWAYFLLRFLHPHNQIIRLHSHLPPPPPPYSPSIFALAALCAAICTAASSHAASASSGCPAPHCIASAIILRFVGP